jgi:hypothetical protein
LRSSSVHKPWRLASIAEIFDISANGGRVRFTGLGDDVLVGGPGSNVLIQ